MVPSAVVDLLNGGISIALWVTLYYVVEIYSQTGDAVDIQVVSAFLTTGAH